MIFFVPIWAIIFALLMAFVFGKMVFETAISALSVIFSIILAAIFGRLIIKGLKELMSDMHGQDNDFSWEDN